MSKLRQTVSHPVLARLSVMQDQGWLTVLATAAPDCYAKPFAQSLGIDDCLATPTVATRGEWAELIGEEKARACKSWVETRSMGTAAQLVAITDHYDDMPLLRMASRVIIQASTEEAAGLVAELSTEVPIEHIDPVTDEGVGGMWLWMDDRPAGPYDSWEVRTILSKHRHALLYKGNAQWGRVLPGGSLAEAALRAECPRPPAIRDRISIAARRRVVRDLLGIFH